MTDDLDLEIVRELHPPLDEPTGSETANARERARAALMAEVARADRSRRRSSWLLPWLGGRRLAPVLVLSGAVAVAAGVVLPLLLGGGAANPSSAAAAVLQRAAHAAGAASGPWQLRSGEYWYVKSYETRAGAEVADPSVRGGIRVIVDALTTIERQTWISVDRPGLDVRRIARPITFLSAAARRQWVRQGRPHQVPLRTRWQVRPDDFFHPYRQLLALPSNVDGLWRMLERYAGNGSSTSRHAEMFTGSETCCESSRSRPRCAPPSMLPPHGSLASRWWGSRTTASDAEHLRLDSPTAESVRNCCSILTPTSYSVSDPWS